MPYYITATNLAEITDLSVLHQKPGSPAMQIRKHLQDVGTFHTTAIMLPNIQILDFAWQVQDDLVLENNIMEDTVDINFHLQGALDSCFPHIGSLDMRTCRHNLLFSQDMSRHQVAGNQQLQMFHVSLKREFFRELIGYEDAWSEKLQYKLEKEEPFKAVEGLPAMTPVMQQLIHSIQHNSWQGSIRNLQLQSKMYELLALQMEQFKVMEAKHPGFSKADEDKLHGVRLYLQQHFLEELSLTQLCRLAMLNEFKLKKGFKELFGTTVFGYVKTLQMEYAGRLLKEERKTVEDVAYTLGYEHAHHFSTSFKKYFGSSPLRWGR